MRLSRDWRRDFRYRRERVDFLVGRETYGKRLRNIQGESESVSAATSANGP